MPSFPVNRWDASLSSGYTWCHTHQHTGTFPQNHSLSVHLCGELWPESCAASCPLIAPWVSLCLRLCGGLWAFLPGVSGLGPVVSLLACWWSRGLSSEGYRQTPGSACSLLSAGTLPAQFPRMLCSVRNEMGWDRARSPNIMYIGVGVASGVGRIFEFSTTSFEMT